MKRIKFYIWFFFLCLLLPQYLHAAAGSCVATNAETLNPLGTSATFKTLTFVCTFGTGGNEVDPLTGTLTAAQASELRGWYLLLGTTYNGSTAPTDLYDLVLKETVGATAAAVDILGTGGMNRPGTAGVSSQFKPLIDTTYLVPGLRPVLNTLTLTASGNAVVSGSFTAQFIFVR